MSSNIFAYTAPGGNYPEYISVNTDDEKNVMFTVRGPAKNGVCGDTACVLLSQEQVQSLARQLHSFVFEQGKNV
jgi:hypothetical protein